MATLNLEFELCKQTSGCPASAVVPLKRNYREVILLNLSSFAKFAEVFVVKVFVIRCIQELCASKAMLD